MQYKLKKFRLYFIAEVLILGVMSWSFESLIWSHIFKGTQQGFQLNECHPTNFQHQLLIHLWLSKIVGSSWKVGIVLCSETMTGQMERAVYDIQEQFWKNYSILELPLHVHQTSRPADFQSSGKNSPNTNCFLIRIKKWLKGDQD